jgi:hypothetical protein
MQRLWDSYPALLVAGNFLYLPLVFDPAIAQELQTAPPVKLATIDPVIACPTLIDAQDSSYIKTVNLESLLKQYGELDPAGWGQVRRTVLGDFADVKPDNPDLPDPKLAVILFEIMPYFLKRSRPFARASLDRENILSLIYEHVRLPASYARQKGNPPDNENLRAAVAGLAQRAASSPGPPPSGLVPAHVLKGWFIQALAAFILAQEQARLNEAMAEQEQWADLYRRHSGLLAYLAETGSLEVDGFGFSRLRGKNEYRIYKRTGVYALKDFYGRPHIFPDCRVAVSTSRRLNPFVIEHYKHPLLRRHSSGQEICAPKDFQPSLKFSAAGIIKALETGVNALYYGYNARRRNGYHSLDRIHQELVIEFDDYRVPPDDPRIASGEIEIKNIFD